MGIMFLMYRFGRLVALVYIRRTLAGEDGETKTDQGFYGHGRTTRDPAQRTTGQVKAALVEDDPVPLYNAANDTRIIKAGAK
jgi:hypothetical protein